jgi:hypothetical protein
MKAHPLIPEALRDEGGAASVVYSKGHHDPEAFAAAVAIEQKEAEEDLEGAWTDWPTVETAKVRHILARVLPIGRGTESYEEGFRYTLDYPIEKRGPGVFPVTLFEVRW